jgi:serine/threonine protein kinase
MENQYILYHTNHTMQDLEKIHPYCTKHAKLALSLARDHNSKILHNNIFPSNILLHFPPDHVNRVYIGICDWGMATCLIKDIPSVYVFPTKDEMERNKKEHFWVALELFYFYGPPNFETSLEHV